MDSSGGHIGWSVIFGAFVLIDFFMASYGAALQNIGDAFLEKCYDEKNPRTEKLEKLKDEPEIFIHACWFWMILTAVPALGICEGLTGMKRFITGLILAVIVYLAGKSIPALIGKKYAQKVSLSLLPACRALTYICLPLTWLLTGASLGIARLFGVKASDIEDEVTEDEIISMVNEGHEQGVLDEHEAEMIQNIFSLDDKQARDIMTHRKNIVGVSADLSLPEAIRFMVNEPNSRFPVYEENIDNILGVLHLKDAVLFQTRKEYADTPIRDIKDLIRPVSFIPKTRNIDLLFHSMQAQKMQMVIVVDEYGETAGLVTMEDILEEIVGNILDEYDKDEKFILPQDDGSFILAGMAPISSVEEALGISFHEEDYDTLSGYLISCLDRIPEENEHSVIEREGWSFMIMQVENRTIKWVRAVRKPEEKAQEEQGQSRDNAGRKDSSRTAQAENEGNGASS